MLSFGCERREFSFALGAQRRKRAQGRRALLGLEAYAEAEAAFRRGLVLDADHAGCADGRDEAARAGAQHKLDILRTGSQVLDIDPSTLAAAPPPIRSLR